MTNKEQHSKIMKAVKKYIKKLDLTDRTIDCHLVSETSIEHEWYDACVTSRDYRIGEYDINFTKEAFHNIDEIALHELLHVLLWGICEVVDGIVKVGAFTEEQRKRMLLKLDEQEHLVIYKLIKALK